MRAVTYFRIIEGELEVGPTAGASFLLTPPPVFEIEDEYINRLSFRSVLQVMAISRGAGGKYSVAFPYLYYVLRHDAELDKAEAEQLYADVPYFPHGAFVVSAMQQLDEVLRVFYDDLDRFSVSDSAIARSVLKDFDLLALVYTLANGDATRFEQALSLNTETALTYIRFQVRQGYVSHKELERVKKR